MRSSDEQISLFDWLERTPWTIDFENRPMAKQLAAIVEICRLETHNSVTKDDLLSLLRWLAQLTIEETET